MLIGYLSLSFVVVGAQIDFMLRGAYNKIKIFLKILFQVSTACRLSEVTVPPDGKFSPIQAKFNPIMVYLFC